MIPSVSDKDYVKLVLKKARISQDREKTVADLASQEAE